MAPIQSAEDLLAELEPLTYGQRVRRLLDLGRQAASDAEASDLLRQLEAGEGYARWLALHACYTSRNGAHVLRALADPSRLVRRLAQNLVPLACDDPQVGQALAALNPRDRVRLLRALPRRRRTAPVDVYLTHQAERGDRDFTALLAFGSDALVARHLDAVLPAAGVTDWARLARWHPTLITERLERLVGEVDDVDARVHMAVAAALPFLVEDNPDRALDIVLRVAERGASLAGLDLQPIADRRPQRVADLMLGSDGDVGPRVVGGRQHPVTRRVQRRLARVRPDVLAQHLATQWISGVSFTRRTHRLADEQILGLLLRYPGSLQPAAGWLERLPAARRQVVYDAANRGWRDAGGVVPHDVVALMPPPIREAEGRRHLALAALATRPVQRLPYAAFLPWTEARATTDPFVNNPDADLRGAALAALVFAVRYQREQAGELLALLRARKNEQDPVRLTFLQALAALPPGVWQPRHLDDLSGVMREALDAADLSAATGYAVERLVLRLLPLQPEWAMAWLDTLLRERGTISHYGLQVNVSDAEMRRLAPIILPVLRTWQTQERVTALLTFAQALGRRLRQFDGLLSVLEDVLRTTRSSSMAQAILALLAEHRPGRVDALVPELLAEDASFERLPTVYLHLHRRRQDLLTPHLGQHAHKGRFATGHTRFVLPLLDGFERWTPRQQALFASVLRTVTGEATRDTPAIHVAIQQLAALPWVEPRRLEQLASATNQKLAIRDAALRALARLDDGAGVLILLAALDDDRARIAIYALRQAVLEMPTDGALALLRGVPLTRVTVAKEVVRLIGELGTDDAYQELLRWDEEQLHRDVRVALLRAFWDYPERDATWPILLDAARSTDPAIAAGVVRIPADRLSPAAQRHLASVLAHLVRHPEPKVRLDTLQRCATLPITDRDRVLRAPLLEAVASRLPDEVTAAAAAVFATYVARDAAVVGEVVERVLQRPRSLKTVIQALHHATRWNLEPLLPSVRAALAALAIHPLTTTLQVQLALATLSADDVHALLVDLAAANRLHADALGVAVAGLGPLAQRDLDGLAAVEERLRASADERFRRLALAALVAQASTAQGWDDARLERLARYQADPSPLVAAAAWFTLPPGA